MDFIKLRAEKGDPLEIDIDFIEKWRSKLTEISNKRKNEEANAMQ